MSSQKLLLDRIEFNAVKIEAVTGQKFDENDLFPQLNVDFSKIAILTRSSLTYSDEELNDPRHFALTYGVKIDKNQPDNLKVPYQIEVEATGFFRYSGDEEFAGEDRFRAVRFSGYQLLYGAIREMTANITARSSHGLMQLPARNFGSVAKARASEDEVERQSRIALKKPIQVTNAARKSGAKSAAPATKTTSASASKKKAKSTESKKG